VQQLVQWWEMQMDTHGCCILFGASAGIQRRRTLVSLAQQVSVFGLQNRKTRSNHPKGATHECNR